MIVHHARAARTTRGLLVASSSTLLASLAHTIGGGSPPGFVALAVALAFSVPFGILMVGRGARWPGAALAAVVAQLALHATFSLSAGSSPSGLAAGADPHALHASAGPVSREAWLAVAGTGQPGHSEHFGAAMPVAHLVAALLAVASIALADRTVRALARAARGILVAVELFLVPLTEAPAIVARVADRPVRVSALRRLAQVLVRRGPPCGVGAA
ncbi:hypothetical protein M3147_03220 [Agromyces mediolanus]|uniref:hypothetical protein n=1 Tax=Agromyces mediolanus TaxID=41986 RepID=UPI00203F7453|nr:hypothetical protein [Agromyces mediolanus]MCM3656257.1 hypothetical protein [Agromyces mediolanus]